jgi:hypothetical protein
MDVRHAPHLGSTGTCTVKLRVFPVVIKQLLYGDGAWRNTILIVFYPIHIRLQQRNI